MPVQNKGSFHGDELQPTAGINNSAVEMMQASDVFGRVRHGTPVPATTAA